MTGLWTVATAALGRDVPVGETPYPHICGSICYGRPGGPEVRLWSRDCAACGLEREARRDG